METRSWEHEQAVRVAAEVRRLRLAQNRSAVWLADRTKELGVPITRQVIADLETRRRRYVTVGELMVLARALNTTPIALLYPNPAADNRIEVLPDVPAAEMVALQWFSGALDSGGVLTGTVAIDGTPMAGVCDDVDLYQRNLQPVQAAREIWELDERRAALMQREMDDIGPEEKSRIADLIGDIELRIRKLRGVPPAAPSAPPTAGAWVWTAAGRRVVKGAGDGG